MTIFLAHDRCAGRQDLIYRKLSSAYEAIRVRPIEIQKRGPCSKSANTIDLFHPPFTTLTAMAQPGCWHSMCLSDPLLIRLHTAVELSLHPECLIPGSREAKLSAKQSLPGLLPAPVEFRCDLWLSVFFNRFVPNIVSPINKNRDNDEE